MRELTFTREELASTSFEPRTVVIMRGVSGCGKTTFKNNYGGRRHTSVSADDYMVGEDGKYKFVREKLGECHAQCFKSFIISVSSPITPDVVFVDNTNASKEEITPYSLGARAFGWKVMIITFLWKPLNESENRNVHNVDFGFVKSKAEVIEKIGLPHFWEATHIKVNG